MKNRRIVSGLLGSHRAFVAIVLSILLCIASIAPAVSVYATDDVNDKAQVENTQGEGDSTASFNAENTEESNVGSNADSEIEEKTEKTTEKTTEPEATETKEETKETTEEVEAPKAAEVAQAPKAADTAEAETASQTAPQAEIKGVAFIGDEAYESLQAAVDAASDGDTITLAEDVSEVITVSGKKLTIDLDGHAIKAVANGESKNGEILSAVKNKDNSELVIKNGSIEDGKAGSGDAGTIDNRSSKLTLENVTVRDCEGIAIENQGKLILNDCLFTENYDSAKRAASMIRVSADGATLEANNCEFTDNKLEWYSLVSASRTTTLRFNSCDIHNNNVGEASIETGSNVSIYLTDTTIKKNIQDNAQYNYSNRTGGIKTSGRIYFDKSAVYGNDTVGSSKGKDFYISSLKGGEVPLPENMYDHGTKLKNYELFSSYDGLKLTDPIKGETDYDSFSVEPADADDVFEYDGQTYPSLAKAVEAMNGQPGTIKMLGDAAIGGQFKGHEGIVLDMDGHSITSKSKGLSAVRMTGGSITIKNGSFENCKGDNGTAIYVSEGDLTLENVDFINNEGRAVYLYHNAPLKGTDPTDYKLTVDNCNFKDNGLNEGAYAPHTLFVVGASADITNSNFDGNFSAIRMSNSLLTEDEASHKHANIENCTFTGHKGNVIELYMAVYNDTNITNCSFTDNHIEKRDSNNKSTILVDEVRHYSEDKYSGGNLTMKDCVISGNSGGDTTIECSTGVNTFENCLIENNEGDYAGGIYADPRSKIVLRDTVVRNNHSNGETKNSKGEPQKVRASAGGIVVRAAKYYNVTPIVNGYIPPGGTTQYQGYFYAPIDVQGGAIYGNTNDNDAGAKDIFINDSKSIKNLPGYHEMKDDDFDFANFDIPENGVIIEKREEVPSKVYVDPVNGKDDNDGDRTTPVKTWNKAVRLLGEYAASGIYVMNTIEIENEDPESEDAVPAINLGGKYIYRDFGHKGALFNVKSGNLTIKDAVISGGALSAEKAAVTVDEGASLTLANGSRITKNGHYDTEAPLFGGGVYAEGEVLMQEGSLVDNNAAEAGGGICLYGGSLVMDGGTIDANQAVASHKIDAHTSSNVTKSYGGGVAVIYGSSMQMNGGTISNNKAYASGGGIATGLYYGDSVTNGGENTLVMDGGTIDNNSAYSSGGGIFVQAHTKATVNAGYITNNCADSNNAWHAGGGIYVNGVSDRDTKALGTFSAGRLYVKNVEIANNTAEWDGGAIAWCGTGYGAMYDVNGTVIYDNKSNGVSHGDIPGFGNTDLAFYDYFGEWYYDSMEVPKLDAEGHVVKDENNEPIMEVRLVPHWRVDPDQDVTYDAPTYLATTMMNGASYDWVDQYGVKLDEERLKTTQETIYARTSATASDPDVQESVKLATVHITGNYSGSGGGGIGTNGAIFIGKDTPPEEEEPPTEEEEEPPTEEEEEPPVEEEEEPPVEEEVPPADEPVEEETLEEYIPKVEETPDVKEVYELPVESKEVIEIEVKSAVKKTSVDTGDSADLYAWVLMAVIAASMLAVCGIMRRKRA